MNGTADSTGKWCVPQFSGPALLGDPPRPCPELLTADEAVRYLRLDTISIANPAATLRRYRERGLLRGTLISKKIFYRRTELDRFIERATEGSPR
jgi:hypothetical protein